MYIRLPNKQKILPFLLSEMVRLCRGPFFPHSECDESSKPEKFCINCLTIRKICLHKLHCCRIEQLLNLKLSTLYCLLPRMIIYLFNLFDLENIITACFKVRQQSEQNIIKEQACTGSTCSGLFTCKKIARCNPKK